MPSLYFEPKSLNELKDILKNAEANKKKIRVVGCGHSPSAICCTNDFMVSLKHFNKILDVIFKISIKKQLPILLKN